MGKKLREMADEDDVGEPNANEPTTAGELGLGESVSETCDGPQKKRKRQNQKDNTKKDDKNTKKVLLML